MTSSKKEGREETKPFLHLRVVEGQTNDSWVGQIEELPGIIVQSGSEEGLIEEARKSVLLYIKTFNDWYELIPSRIEVA